MSYDWKEIMKTKKVGELLDVISGISHLSSEAKDFARLELESRGIDISNNKEIELERLIEEFNETNRGKGLLLKRDSRFTFHQFLVSCIVGVISIVGIFMDSFEFDILYKIFFLIVFPFLSIYLFISYRRKANRELFVRRRIKELKGLKEREENN